MTAGHFIFIPSVLLLGLVIGWILGSRVARDAYAAELKAFVDHCRSATPFPVDHGDGLRAMEVIDAATASMQREGAPR